jgi:hypothetical protein
MQKMFDDTIVFAGYIMALSARHECGKRLMGKIKAQKTTVHNAIEQAVMIEFMEHLQDKSQKMIDLSLVNLESNREALAKLQLEMLELLDTNTFKQITALEKQS